MMIARLMPGWLLPADEHQHPDSVRMTHPTLTHDFAAKFLRFFSEKAFSGSMCQKRLHLLRNKGL
jgi:hypothetical protein